MDTSRFLRPATQPSNTEVQLWLLHVAVIGVPWGYSTDRTRSYHACSSCRVPSTVSQLAETTAVLRYETYEASQEVFGCVFSTNTQLSAITCCILQAKQRIPF